jgi:hypothetical protein
VPPATIWPWLAIKVCAGNLTLQSPPLEVLHHCWRQQWTEPSLHLRGASGSRPFELSSTLLRGAPAVERPQHDEHGICTKVLIPNPVNHKHK